MFPNVTHAAKSWRVAIVHEVVDVEHYRLRDGRLVRPLGVDVIQSFPWTDQEACHSREAFQQLKSGLEGQKIKIYSEKNAPSGDYRIKAEDVEVNLWLLAHGFATIKPDHGLYVTVLKKYQAAQREALLASRGTWGACGVVPTRLRLKAQHARSPSRLQDPVSVAAIKKILPGPILLTAKNKKIKLLGITTPENACMQEQIQSFLETWLVGREIFLYREKINQDDQDAFLRYAFLPPRNKNEPEFFIQQVLIQQGLAHPDPALPYHWYSREINLAWKKQEENLQGGWLSCGGSL